MSVSASRSQFRADRRSGSGDSGTEGPVETTVAAWISMLIVLSIALVLL
ncbi:hypothetical protein [Nocardia abscessus]|uniref:Uncharacterized protein n=1 Tax=Nocardia abscessus TaxID=120957 RepID=A0ABS0CEU9_9NOCA|nr:hypothetical protein [Nocardia abscessus]MBF6228032.1 hypothetical protein [Nocardia abscessus]